MSKSEHVTLHFSHQKVPRAEAEVAGQRAYEFFYGNTKPELSPLTLLSYSVRRYDDNKTLSAEMRKKLTDEGFLSHGEQIPLRRRLRLPGAVAVSLVIPEIEHGQVIGEYLEEPFREVSLLDDWYRAVAKPAVQAGTRLSWIRD